MSDSDSILSKPLPWWLSILTGVLVYFLGRLLADAYAGTWGVIFGAGLVLLGPVIVLIGIVQGAIAWDKKSGLIK